MEDTVLLPDKKRRLLNRSQSASQSTIWSRGGSAANALRPDSTTRRRQDGGMDDMDEDEVLGPSPLKKDTTYKPIFDDPPAFAFGKGGLSRTNSLPPSMLLFGKKKCEQPSQRRVERLEDGQLPTPSSSSTGTAPSGKRKRSGSESGSGIEVDDRSTGSIAGLGLIPPSPPPTRENEQQQQQLRWKGKGKPATGKGKKKARIVSEGTSGEDDDNIVEELAWTPVGPLKRHAQPADVDAEPDLGLEEPLIARSRGRLVVEEPEQEGDFKIDLPDQLKDILALTPSQRNKEDGEAIVRNLLTGRGEFLSRAEVWAAGEVAENNGDDDDDWDGEPGGWWEAEL